MLSAEQIAMRSNFIGGSEVAVILGLNPYRTPEDLWNEKLGRGVPFEGNRHTERGDMLEDAIAQWWCHRTGGRILEKPTTLLHARLPHVAATPDRIAELDGQRICLSIKVPSFFSGKKWGDEVPPMYAAQLIQEMGVLASLGMEVDRGELAAFICDDLKPFKVAYEPEVSSALCERANAWFLHHVVNGVRP